MPSLMPGTPGTKEAYGIAVVSEAGCIAIPPKPMERYGLSDGDFVLLCTTHRGEGGLAILNKEKAENSVFGKYIGLMNQTDEVFYFNDKAYTLTQIRNGSVRLTPDMLSAYHLKINDRLMMVKSTTMAISYTPIEIWKEKFRKYGMDEAIENMEKLEVFHVVYE